MVFLLSFKCHRVDGRMEGVRGRGFNEEIEKEGSGEGMNIE